MPTLFLTVRYKFFQPVSSSAYCEKAVADFLLTIDLLHGVNFCHLLPFSLLFLQRRQGLFPTCHLTRSIFLSGAKTIQLKSLGTAQLLPSAT